MTTSRGRRSGDQTPRHGRLPRALLVVAALVFAVAGCSGGSDAVDASAGGSYGFVQQAPGQEFVPVDDRTAAPVLAGTTLDGSALDFGTYRGRIVVVNFWASWCAPCRAETPDLVELAGEYPEVAFVGVNEKDSESAAKAFVRDFEVTYPSLVDKIGTLAARWPVPPGLPSTFVLDPEGRLAVRFTGGVLGDELRPVLDQLVAEPRR